MLNNIQLQKILFLDIETVPQHASYEDVPERLKALWDKKSLQITRGEEEPEASYQRAGIYAEFGKIVCISVGAFSSDDTLNFRLKSFFGSDEKQLLTEFADLLHKHYSHRDQLLCAHNGKEFDFPYICRRMLVNGIELPFILNIAGKKPWEVAHLDTMELWKFGDYKHYTSLNLLTAIFDIPTPKDDIDGSDVGRVFWEENDVERIANYCQKDVLTIAQLVLRYKGLPLVEPENVSIS